MEQRCAHCGDRYRVTLYDVLFEHRVQQEWQPMRPCSSCAVENTFLLDAIPEDALHQIEEAWGQVVEAARRKGIDLRLGA